MKKSCVLGCLGVSLVSVGCGERIKSGEGYELSEIENPGESLDDVDAEEDGEDTGSADAEDSEDDTDPPEPEEEPLDERTFGQKLVVSTLMPGVWDSDNYEEVKTISYLLVHWVRDGNEVTWTEELCDISSTEAHGTQTSFPAAFVASMPIREHEAVLSAAEVGADFDTERFVNIDGVTLSNPSTESLPTSSSDGRLRDQDSDGHPGVTIHVDAGIVAGDVYVAQRSVFQISGVVVAQDRIEAYVDYEADQSILGASNPFLTMAEVTPIPNPDPTTSYIIFQQVDDASDCGDIKREQDDLFE